MNIFSLVQIVIAVVVFFCMYFFAVLLMKLIEVLKGNSSHESSKLDDLEFFPSVSGRKLSRVKKYFLWYEELSFRKVRLWLLALLILSFLCFLLDFWLFFGFLILLLIAFVTRIFRQVNVRRYLFARQLPESLMSVLASLKAGFTIDQAFVVAERESELPVKKAYSSLIRARRLGMSLSEALMRVSDELNLQEWTMVSEVLQIQQRVGGNIIPIVEEVASVLRERIRLEQEVKTSTATGRLTGILLGLLAPISFIILYFAAPGYIEVLYKTDMGKILLLISGLLEFIGFILIWKIIKVEY